MPLDAVAFGGCDKGCRSVMRSLHLDGAEETRQFNGLLAEDRTLRNPGRYDEFREEVNEPVHLRAAGYGAA